MTASQAARHDAGTSRARHTTAWTGRTETDDTPTPVTEIPAAVHENSARRTW